MHKKRYVRNNMCDMILKHYFIQINYAWYVIVHKIAYLQLSFMKNCIVLSIKFAQLLLIVRKKRLNEALPVL